MKKFITLLLFLSTLFSYAQIGIGTDNPDPSAAIDIVSSNSGMLLPRLKMSERDNISNPAQGLMIYCTDCGSNGQLQLFNGSSWFGLSLTEASSNDMDNDGYTNDVDCDDTNPNINPGATETCNGIDDDCDGTVDAYSTDQPCNAGVGACQTTGQIICENGVLVCDAVPGDPVEEICGNGIDDNCDGDIDEGCVEICDNGIDDDGDGAVDGDDSDCIFDNDADGYTSDVDCDDNDPNVNPGATETCNGIDDDCDGIIDNNSNDNDCDGVLSLEDCDDNDPNNTNSNMDDMDCDGVRSWEDCDDNDPNNTNTNMDDNDCDGVRSWEDCDDNDPNNTNSNMDDNDCDGWRSWEDCDDNDPNVGPCPIQNPKKEDD